MIRDYFALCTAGESLFTTRTWLARHSRENTLAGRRTVHRLAGLPTPERQLRELLLPGFARTGTAYTRAAAPHGNTTRPTHTAVPIHTTIPIPRPPRPARLTHDTTHTHDHPAPCVSRHHHPHTAAPSMQSSPTPSGDPPRTVHQSVTVKRRSPALHWNA